ncbi:MAG: hypothetical protein WBA07_32860 [Rivularia sp. (in: cyanobacteria)]
MYSFKEIGRVIGLLPEESFESFLEIQEYFFKNFGNVGRPLDIDDRLTHAEAELLIMAATGFSALDLLIGESD